jgi:hypothetical protein
LLRHVDLVKTAQSTGMLTLPFAGLIVASIAVSLLAARSTAAGDRGMMPPSFVVDFAALLLLGGNAALVVAAIGFATRWVAHDWGRPLRRMLLNAATILIATEAAWLAYAAAGGAAPPFTWPWQVVPVAAALAALPI